MRGPSLKLFFCFIRGVNLGGYLLLEPWITPKLFEDVNIRYNDTVVDEFTMALYMDPQERMDVLTQ